MKLSRNQLKNLIIQEIENIEEDSLRSTHDDPGRQHRHSRVQSGMTRSCQECGSAMYEDESSCMECGSMYRESLNEGDCGCGPSQPSVVHTMLSHDHKHHNNYMAKPALYKVAKYAIRLLEMIPEGYELDDWQRTKIAQISDDISEVYHSIDYDHAKGEL